MVSFFGTVDTPIQGYEEIEQVMVLVAIGVEVLQKPSASPEKIKKVIIQKIVSDKRSLSAEKQREQAALAPETLDQNKL